MIFETVLGRRVFNANQVKMPKQRWPNSNGALISYQKTISFGDLVLVTHAKAVQLVVKVGRLHKLAN